LSIHGRGPISRDVLVFSKEEWAITMGCSPQRVVARLTWCRCPRRNCASGRRRRTRDSFADTAARLFAERGYENVAVSDVTREADVPEQAVFNYFPTKERLVIDRDEQ
jgi:hypothetical protein